MNPSAVLMFNFGTAHAASREDVQTACAAHGEVAFVDFRPGAHWGYVRFRGSDGATAALNALLGTALGGLVPTWTQLTVAEASAYREQVEAAKRQRFEPFGGKGGKGGGGRGAPRGWGGGMGGGRGRGRVAW